MSNNTLFVAQIVSVLTYVGIAVGLYALVIKQKDATIEFLQKQLDAAKESSTDNLVKQLDQRAKIFEAELERLSTDKNTTEARLKQKEQELQALRTKVQHSIENFQTIVQALNETSEALGKIKLPGKK